MTYLFVRHKVDDYAKWKTVFDEHSATRKAGGSKGGRLFWNADNPNEIVIHFKWDNLENARNFAESENLRETMQKAGVSDKPDIYFLEEIEQVSY